MELRAGAPRTALAGCQHALALDERSQGAESPDVALDLACLGEAWLALDQPAQARPLLERALGIHERAPGDKLDAAWVRFLLARALESPAPRARALLDEAQGLLEGLGLRAREELRALRAWRDHHP